VRGRAGLPEGPRRDDGGRATAKPLAGRDLTHAGSGCLTGLFDTTQTTLAIALT
jgi:hypothetical protein